MINKIQLYIDQLVNGQSLSRADAGHAFQILMHDGATPAEIAALLVALRMKGETMDEITGAAQAMRAKMIRIKAPIGAIDVCGTGGDGLNTLNISTAVAIVVAACGVPVAKHGNRSVSSLSGSAEVLRELGVDIDAEPTRIERSMNECNIGFMFAPRFHPAMRYVAPVRQELGIRTTFNLIGPLCNPAEPKRQLVGIYDPRKLELIAQVLRELGSEKAWVVHGDQGLDELSISGPSRIAELKKGIITSFTITPEEAGLEPQPPISIRGRTPGDNAKALLNLLLGATGAYRDIVLLNASAALMVADKVMNIKEGVLMAAEAIDSHRAKETLASLVLITNETPEAKK